MKDGLINFISTRADSLRRDTNDLVDDVQLTKYMEQSLSWVANSHSATQEISRPLWNLKVHNRVHKSLSLSYPKPDASIPHYPSHIFRNYKGGA